MDTSVDSKTFNDYAGRYDYRTGIMTVTVEGDALYAQLTSQPKLQIFPKGKDEFFPKVVDAQMLFVRDEQGKVVAIRHTQDGQTFRAPRLGQPVVNLTPGQFQYGPASIMTITRDGTQLWAQLSGQPKFPIFAKSTTEFEWHIVPAAVKFVIGEDGKVVKVIHTQNGRTIEAPKIK